MHPIERAVMPLKADAIERATKEAKEYVERIREELAAADGDVNVVAPYPSVSIRMSQFERMGALYRYQNVHSIVSADPARDVRYSRHTPYYVVIDETKVNKFIQDRIDQAIIDYDNFVLKLINKIGEVKDAALIGNHVWDYSTLVVTKLDGERQAWKTQQIVNVSKLGKLYNQWPSRRMKAVPKLEEAA